MSASKWRLKLSVSPGEGGKSGRGAGAGLGLAQSCGVRKLRPGERPLVSPDPQRGFEEFFEVFGGGGARGELGHTVLGERAFDEGGDVSGRIAERAESFRQVQSIHEPSDPIGEYSAGILRLAP